MCHRAPFKVLCVAEHRYKILPLSSRKIYPEALCTTLDQPNKGTLDLRAYAMDPKRACDCSWPVCTLGVYQPSIRHHSQLRKEMESVTSKPLPKRPFRISIAEQINSALAKPLCDTKRVVLLDALRWPELCKKLRLMGHARRLVA
jgi:hypothetical protein